MLDLVPNLPFPFNLLAYAAIVLAGLILALVIVAVTTGGTGLVTWVITTLSDKHAEDSRRRNEAVKEREAAITEDRTPGERVRIRS